MVIQEHSGSFAKKCLILTKEGFLMPDASKLYIGTLIEQKLPVIVKYLAHWQRMAFVLRLIHALLGVMAIIFSLLAAAQIGSIADEYAKVFG
jgi:hypothetical protein